MGINHNGSQVALCILKSDEAVLFSMSIFTICKKLQSYDERGIQELKREGVCGFNKILLGASWEGKDFFNFVSERKTREFLEAPSALPHLSQRNRTLILPGRSRPE